MKKAVSIVIVSWIFFFLITYSNLFASTRGISVVSKQGKHLYLYKDYHALVVGVGDYDHWPDLRGAVKDAKEVAGVLGDLDIKAKLIINPTSRELKQALNNLVYDLGGEKDRALVLFFSGHGETETLATGEKLGYIIPKDCPILTHDPMGFSDKAISMKMIEAYALRIKSKHVLMVFDSCFSGSVFASLKGVPSDISEKSNLPVRQFITAGNENEEVPDISVFTPCFVQGIRGKADFNRDGYVTGSELGMYLDTNVVNYTQGGQHPQYGKIRHPRLDKGDFIFVPKLAQARAPAVPVAEEMQRLAQDRKRLSQEMERLEAKKRLLEELKKLETQRQRIEKQLQELDLGAVPKTKPEAPPVQVERPLQPSVAPYKLAIFPWSLRRESKYYTRYVIEALNGVLDKTESFVPTYSYYDLKKKFKAKTINDEIISDADVGKLWVSKDSLPSAYEPNINLICQLGKKLEIDTVLTYSLDFSEGDGRRLFHLPINMHPTSTDPRSRIDIFLIDVQSKRRYFNGESLKFLSRGEGVYEVKKLTKKAFTDYRKGKVK